MTPLPKRVFNSPLMMCANYTDGTHMNLIKLSNPYANGYGYAIHSTANPADSKMYKTEQKAREKFNQLVNHSKLREPIKTITP